MKTGRDCPDKCPSLPLCVYIGSVLEKDSVEQSTVIVGLEIGVRVQVQVLVGSALIAVNHDQPFFFRSNRSVLHNKVNTDQTRPDQTRLEKFNKNSREARG